MKYQVLFSLKKKKMKKYLRMSSAAVVMGTLRVNTGSFALYYGSRDSKKVAA